MTVKPFWESKTFWFNFVVGVVALFWGDVKPYVSPEVAGLVVVAGNLVLRALTNQGISLA